jgi:hypothetical protein
LASKFYVKDYETGRVWSGVILCLDGYSGLEVLLLLILPLSLGLHLVVVLIGAL